ncbi:peptide chain release factor 1 [Bifidobacterium psychraerophilum]|uniref:Peptide chain release factor 1 n=1 Tax=Bifidobacterium psychraerophilum TaxID=218140 RepID=A0A087CGB4_9BIFI|nr:peptide chain release factor 1 [Bifidobacterium psychraerophilum]KFI82314.1 peptide chain release factor 1 [Bifidobacterium psychraerophilum]MCI1660189.1 peptide chain release factor 1 [Bifidobacterium psychraerophilum]MCI1804153.1 peptide chain release factor 1 [Bifidobacterium psychraerophilum]MCI2176487.1 peptide chain release factor 1 [Bifidobacterium psychraerophilum]MCI2182003.1 peptide chain release factor 1 [Bifidobacterium psychraerophilum]
MPSDEQFPAAATALSEYQRIEQQMSDPEVASDPNAMRKLGRRHAELGSIVSIYREYTNLLDDYEAAQEMASEDSDFAQEAKRLEAEIPAITEKLRTALIPRDPDDSRNTIMEIKAGSGGEEAALFAGDLLRMYTRYTEKRGWSTEVMNENTTELGGIKDIQLAIRAKGNVAPADGVWASLKYEGGVHRVQRVPVTESQGRIQTSAAGVIVFPEADEDDDEVEVDAKDLKIDIFMSSGPGGQSVNTTYSAVRMTHIPTGIVVSMQDQKSQIQNRQAALRVLKSRLLAMKHEQDAAEAADMRHSQVRSLDRSERIRTYNFPENRIVDHRTGYKAYNLDQVLDGDLQDVINSDISADEAERLEQQR